MRVNTVLGTLTVWAAVLFFTGTSINLICDLPVVTEFWLVDLKGASKFCRRPLCCSSTPDRSGCTCTVRTPAGSRLQSCKFDAIRDDFISVSADGLPANQGINIWDGMVGYHQEIDLQCRFLERNM
jgi:hypothetical protein